MRQKAFIKLEKKLACDLKPGELFVLDSEIAKNLNGPEPGLEVFIRTNVSEQEFSETDTLVYKVHITIVDPEDPLPPRVNPHAPPGMKDEK